MALALALLLISNVLVALAYNVALTRVRRQIRQIGEEFEKYQAAVDTKINAIYLTPDDRALLGMPPIPEQTTGKYDADCARGTHRYEPRKLDKPRRPKNKKYADSDGSIYVRKCSNCTQRQILAVISSADMWLDD